MSHGPGAGLDCGAFLGMLAARGVDFFAGVPDSLLKSVCRCIADHAGPNRHVVAANEGGAVALAAGYHLATGRIPLVYLQNSGQGNALNPLASLVDREVYGIPMLLLIGWRGEPGTAEEAQHIRQGRITGPVLDALEIPTSVLPQVAHEVEAVLDEGIRVAVEGERPSALLVRGGTFESYAGQEGIDEELALGREDAVIQVAEALPERAVLVCTTGKASRELFEHAERSGRGRERTFLNVGSMGHASQIALGLALARPDLEVWCLDGDGSLIMHMGALAVIGQHAPGNFKHIVVNNGAHDSVGGQPTAGFDIAIPGVAEACGYRRTSQVETHGQVRTSLAELAGQAGPCLLEIRVARGARSDLGRPTVSTHERKRTFMEFISAA